MSTLFNPESPQGRILAQWWRDLADDRGARAQLRRARGPAEVAIQPSIVRLITRMRSTMSGEHGWEGRIAMIAGLLAHLDSHDEQQVLASTTSLAEAMATRKDAGPIVSELRFRRLLQRERIDLYVPMTRVLRMLNGKANLFDLAESVYWWGDGVRKRWAYAYFPLVPEKKSA